MDAAEEEAASKKFAFTPNPGDLSDGGIVNGAKLRPNADKRITQGRPAARRAWTWNGTETVLPLAWNPDGNRHDGARHYLLKRHCLCCHAGGFFGRQCRACVQNNCQKCRASTDTVTEQVLENGKTVRGWIIPNFYLRKDDVPFQARFYGGVDCFLQFCPRRGTRGFLTEQDMRIHARSRHRMEYQAHIESQTANRSDQVETLQKRVDDLMGRLATQTAAPTPQLQAAPQQTSAQERMTKARAAKSTKRR